jgi:hypothetical protein
MLALVAFGMMVISCDLLEDLSSSSFEFRIQSNRYMASGWDTITKIEFINGSKSSDPILETKVVNIPKGEKSEIYKVSDFNKEVSYDKDYFYIGVKLTFSDSDTVFGNTTRKKIVVGRFKFGFQLLLRIFWILT